MFQLSRWECRSFFFILDIFLIWCKYQKRIIIDCFLCWKNNYTIIIHIQNVEQQDALIFKCFITSFGYKLSIIRLSMLKDDILQKIFLNIYCLTLHCKSYWFLFKHHFCLCIYLSRSKCKSVFCFSLIRVFFFFLYTYMTIQMNYLKKNLF